MEVLHYNLDMTPESEWKIVSVGPEYWNMAAKPIGFLPEAFFGLTAVRRSIIIPRRTRDSGMFYGFTSAARRRGRIIRRF